MNFNKKNFFEKYGVFLKFYNKNYIQQIDCFNFIVIGIIYCLQLMKVLNSLEMRIYVDLFNGYD